MDAAHHSSRRIPAETKRRIAAKLVHGRDSTVQLQFLLRSPTATELHRQALADEILTVFTEAISDLDSPESVSNEITCPDHSLCSDLDSGNSRRSTAFKDLGRANKKRKVADKSIVTSTTTEDGHAWRKYGQKKILNMTYPRSYYRCTHKFEQGCEATKHVQRMEGNAEIYKITYTSNHKCSNTSPIVAVDTPNSASDSCNIYFSGATDEIDLWLNLKDIENLPGATTSDDTQLYFSMGDNVDSSPMFWS